MKTKTEEIEKKEKKERLPQRNRYFPIQISMLVLQP
jgi:hypothetical protein